MRYPNLDAERIRAGFGKAELAEKLGVTRRTLYNWEITDGFPLSKLRIMAELFGCSIDYLVQPITKEENV